MKGWLTKACTICFQVRAEAADAKKKAADVAAACIAATTPTKGGGWVNLDSAEEKMRKELYKRKKAAVEQAFHGEDPTGEGLITQQGFEAALSSLMIKLGRDATRHIWHLYSSDGMLAGGKLPVTAFMQRFILSAPTASTTREGGAPSIATEGDLTTAVLRNQKKIIVKCRQKDKSNLGCVPFRTFFRILSELGISLNEMECQIVARKFASTLAKGLNYADFVRSFLARSSLV